MNTSEFLTTSGNTFYRGKSSGTTLIELMVVVVIIAILLAIAVPAYTNEMRKTWRADAITSLLNGAQALERCFTRFNAYDSESCPDPSGASPDNYYTVTMIRTATTFTLTASPTGAQLEDACGVYTLDDLGNRTPEPGSKRCWGST